LNTLNDIGYQVEGYKCLIHLDRLSITFRHWSGSTFHNVRNPDFIPHEQVFNAITLIHDNSPGLGAYYHSYKVFFKGRIVGKLHTSAKLKTNEIQFDFAKEVFYSFYPGYWYEVYCSIKKELGFLYNNIMYVEISVDTNKNLVGQFALYYQNAINNKLRLGDRFKMKGKTIVHVMNNGSSFLIDGTDNEISIYNKSMHAENYIRDYFSNNGLKDAEVFRIESKLHWNYIRYLRNKKNLDINVDTLTDQKKLAKIFLISTSNKIAFKDTFTKTIDRNRNSHFHETSIIDDLPIESAVIGRLNPELRNNHYKTESVDENIVRQNYYRFLETGNRLYFRNFKASSFVAGYDRDKMLNLISRFNSKYNGNRTKEITDRMESSSNNISGLPTFNLNSMINTLVKRVRLFLWGLF
jgi:hypothetical protein